MFHIIFFGHFFVLSAWLHLTLPSSVCMNIITEHLIPMLDLMPAHVDRFIEAGVKMCSYGHVTILVFTDEQIIKIMDNHVYGL